MGSFENWGCPKMLILTKKMWIKHQMLDVEIGKHVVNHDFAHLAGSYTCIPSELLALVNKVMVGIAVHRPVQI